jgi:ABC-type oligopeptide transport system ATPase subunit
MKLQYLEFNSFGVLAIGGKSGSGKTSTARFLLAQLAMSGASLVICDPHGKSMQDNLTQAIQPLAKSFACPIAIAHEERMQAIRAVGKIVQDRLSGRDKSLEKIVLVLDEAPRHFMECSAEENRETAQIFLTLANEGRRMNIRVLLLAQNFKQDFIGSRSIRSSITHVLFHRSSRDEVKLFSSIPASYLRTIEILKDGHALLYPDMIQVQIPYISRDDLESAEHLYSAAGVHIDVHARVQRGADDVQENLLSTLLTQQEHLFREPQHPSAPFERKQEKSTETSKVTQACKDIFRKRGEGKNKEQIIYEVFQVRKHGSNPRWRAASKLYNAVLEKYGDPLDR